MADTSTNKMLLPHRGKESTMAEAPKKNIVLASGELFVEYPSTGAGRGKCKIKIGDGVSAYSALPYALGETSTDPITFTQGSEPTIDRALTVISSGKPLNELIGNIKQLGNLIDVEIDALNNEDWYNSTDPARAAHGIMLRDDKTKLNGIQTGAEVNQNAFSTVAINTGSSTVNLAADSKTDTVTLKAGDNVTLTPDAASDTVIIAAKDSVYTAGSGIEISSSNVIKQVKRSATTTSGNNNSSTVQFGTSFKVPKIKFDDNGHMVSSEDVVLTIPEVEDADIEVAQQRTTEDANLLVLLSLGATTASQVGEVKKNENIKFNPRNGNLMVTRINGVVVGDDPKFTDNDTQYTAGAGMTLTGTVFKAKMKQDTASTLACETVSTRAGRQYAVTPDANGVLSVNVPWTDDNTLYYAGGGLALNNSTFSNKGVRSIQTGSTPGSISVVTGKDDGTANAAVDVVVNGTTAAIKDITRNGTTFTATRLNGTTFTFTQQDDNTTYSAGAGIGLDGTSFYNKGVRAVAEGGTNGTINVNTNGGTANVPVKGLGTAAYKADTYFATSGHTHSAATTAANGFMSTTHVSKLAGIAEGAEVNQNAFSNIKVTNGSTNTNLAADSKTDTFNIVAGSNITLTATESSDTLTIAAKDTTYSAGSHINISSGAISARDVVTNVGTGSSAGSNGTINVSGVNASGGTYSIDINVKGLKSAAYTESSAYAASNHNHSGVYLPLSAGSDQSLSGDLYLNSAKSIIFKGTGTIYSSNGSNKLDVGTSSYPIGKIYAGYYCSTGDVNICAGTNGVIHCYTGGWNSTTKATLYCDTTKTDTIDTAYIKSTSYFDIYVRNGLTLQDTSNVYKQITCGSITANSDISTTGKLTVTGASTFSGSMKVSSSATFNSTIQTYGEVTIGNNASTAQHHSLKAWGNVEAGEALSTNQGQVIGINGASGNFLIRTGSTNMAVCAVKYNVTNPTQSSDYQDLYCKDLWYYGTLHPASGGSSREYKENIKDMSDELAEKILDVNIVTFDYKEEYLKGSEEEDRINRRGVIAEEVEEIIPEAVNRAVSTVDNKERITVEYDKFIPYLIKMVQIQNERINELEKEIKNLKK